ncbi:hypothetical protein SUGI_0310110 [Cryptomeria japonica]|nr:hypothetical protein SUGI_0310110 [Cryptomeria japonica]
MTAVSYFRIIAKLFPTSERLARAMKAFNQAKDFTNFLESSDIQESDMSFLDSLVIEADQMSKAADNEFKKVQKPVSSQENVVTVDAAMEVINELLQLAKNSLKENGLFQHVEGAGVQDSRDLRKVVPSYNLYRVSSLCIELLQRNDDDIIELKDLQIKIEDQLDSVIACCVLQVTTKLVRNCKEWARDFEEDKIWNTAYMAGKVKGVLETCCVRPSWIEPQVHNSAEVADMPDT